MAKSIMQTRRECYICRMRYNVITTSMLEEHHVFQAPRRGLSEAYGLKVFLCRRHHTGSDDAVHFNAAAQAWLKAEAQAAFMQQHEPEQWMPLFGKDYSEGSEDIERE